MVLGPIMTSKLNFRVCLVEMMEKWDNGRNLVSLILCLVGGGKVEDRKKMSLYKCTQTSLLKNDA